MSLVLNALGLVAGLLGLLLAYELVGLWFARVPRQPRPAQSVGSGAATHTGIPKVVWSYWDRDPAPAFVQACLANWRQHAADHEIRWLTRDQLDRWIPAERLAAVGLDGLAPYRQADWIRAEVLHRHGGIWIDASTLLTRDLAWLHAARDGHQAEYAGFYLEMFTTRPDQPMVENWLMAAVPGSRFMADLTEAFTRHIQEGESAYVDRLEAEGRRARIVQAIDEGMQHYLLMHLTIADLIDAHPERYRLALLRAEDSALGLHRALRWRKRHLFLKLAWLPCPEPLPDLVKLRSGDRRVCERGLARWGCRQGSFLDRYLPKRTP